MTLYELTELVEQLGYKTPCFKPRAEFPPKGSKCRLYIATDEEKVYIWKNNSYVFVGGGSGGGGTTETSWNLLGTPGVSLGRNQNYILLAEGNFSLPTDAVPGDFVSVINSAGNVTLTSAGGVFYSGPGQMVDNPGDPMGIPPYVRFDLFNVGDDNWATIKAFQSKSNFSDLAVSGQLGILNDLYSDLWIINQTTPNITATLPLPNSALGTTLLTVINRGTEAIVLEGVSIIGGGNVQRFYWEGSTWLSEPIPSPSVYKTLVPNVTLVAANFVFDSGLYEYEYSNALIFANSKVDIVPKNSTVDIVALAEFKPYIEISTGIAKMFCKNLPIADVLVDIWILT